MLQIFKIPVNIFLLIVCLVSFIGCSGESSPTIVYPIPYPTDLKISGNINLANVAVHPDLGGLRSSLVDHSKYKITIQDDSGSETSVSEDGSFTISPITIRDQFVLFCKDTAHPGLILEYMGADSNLLYGEKIISIDIYSTARALIARCMRDKYGIRINPQALGTEHINSTAEAIAQVLEKHPEKLSGTSLDQVSEIKSAYASMSELLKAGESGAYPYNWVFLYYLAGDNDLSPYITANLNDLVQEGNLEKAVILVQADFRMEGMKRYLIKDGKLVELASVGLVDSSDPRYIADLVSWAKRAFPAKNYSLTISSHADGWKANSSSLRKSLISDQSAESTGNPLAIATWLKGANQTFDGAYRPLQALVLDACFMGLVEIGWEFKDVAEYTVFSQGRVPSIGFPLDRIFKSVKSFPLENMTGKDFAFVSAEAYKNEFLQTISENTVCVSVIENAQFPGFFAAFNTYLNALYADKETLGIILKNLRDSVETNSEGTSSYVIQAFENADYRDLKDLLLESRNVLPSIKIQTDLLLNYFPKLIVKNYFSEKYLPDTNGLSISFPASNSYQLNYLDNAPIPYSSYDFCKQSLWNELLAFLNSLN